MVKQAAVTLILLSIGPSLALCADGDTLIFSKKGEAWERTEGSPTAATEQRADRLDIRFKEPHRDAGVNLPVSIGLAAAISGQKKLDLFVDPEKPDFHDVHFEFACSDGECEGNYDSVLPAETSRSLLFPFDGVRLRYEFDFGPEVSWGEITLYNDTRSFVFASNINLEPSANKIGLYGSLSRSLIKRLAAMLLVAGCIASLWFLAISTSQLRVNIGFLSVFLIIGVAIRTLFLSGSLAPVTIVDLSLLMTLILALIIVARKSSYLVQPDYGIFISYRKTDSASEADQLAKRLYQAFSEKKVFFDTQAISRGAEFPREIEKNIRSADLILVMVGPTWKGQPAGENQPAIHEADDWPRREVEIALESGRTIIPLFVRRAGMPDASELPESIRQFSALNGETLGVPPDFDRDVDQLIEEIRGLLVRDGKSTLKKTAPIGRSR